MNKSISFSKAVEGFLLNARARHLSHYTIKDYLTTFRRFAGFLGEDTEIDEISHKEVEIFLATLPVSKKTLLNYHVGLSALWTWAESEELVKEHIIRKVPRPKPEKRAIKPYTEDEVRSMLNALSYSMTYFRPGKRESAHRLQHTERNRAIILLLLDTGIRAAELCSLQIHHVDLKSRWVRVYGKGDKERVLPFSARTGKAIWKYLALRKEDDVVDYLFITKYGDPVQSHSLLKAMRRVGQRAGVRGVTVHRFRHTFAVNYLRNGGDAYSLQMMLGHSTMEMVKTYLALAQADLDKNHKLASPVDNWRL
jgi:site-specific recombinase XerD